MLTLFCIGQHKWKQSKILAQEKMKGKKEPKHRRKTKEKKPARSSDGNSSEGKRHRNFVRGPAQVVIPSGKSQLLDAHARQIGSALRHAYFFFDLVHSGLHGAETHFGSILRA